MIKFDTKIQEIKYEVLKEIIKSVYSENTDNIYVDIPKKISPGPKASLRCCIYKERAILQERIKLALGGDKENPNVVEVIDVACDECPIDGMVVTPACRGCIVHRCESVCTKGAITITDKNTVVDKDKCIECGMCIKACPYGAIIEQRRPCIKSCKVNAITIDENKKACIDNEKCISCGACVYQCPFGAISDKSYILDIIDILRKSNNNQDYKVYAVVAPSIVSQFKYAKIEQVISGICELGFYQVVEAALGADITLYEDIKQFEKDKIVTTSCCPSFVMYIEKNFPKLLKYISSATSPMVETAKIIKRTDPTAKVVFIGPCTSKKLEYKLEKVNGLVDSVMSFEELQAFLDAKEVDITNLHDTVLDDASFYGRIFAKSGGITQGILKMAEIMDIGDIKPISMSGVDECKVNLKKLELGKSSENFFEGMACDGGCINGALCLHRESKNVLEINRYAQEAKEKDIMKHVETYIIDEKAE